MNYSIAKLIEAALTYIMNSELKNPKYELPEGEDFREKLLQYIHRRLEEIKNNHK